MTNVNKAMLEKLVTKGEATREVVQGLKGGKGECIIYKDTQPHPDSKVYESGTILIEEGAAIGAHIHSIDSELWIVLKGSVEVNGIRLELGQYMGCNMGESHCCKNLAKGESVIGFTKKKGSLLLDELRPYSIPVL